MFGFKYGFGYGFTSGYSPLINYRWSSTYQANNQMYSTNSGTGTDLQLYSGQGVKNNGVDHDLDLVDIGATSMIYTLDGVQTYTETPFYSFLGLGGVWNDIAYFNRTLTQTEITKYSTNPNGFFNDALVDDTCVLNMPLAEHSDYCIDYANYSEGQEEITNGTFDSNVDDWVSNNSGASITWQSSGTAIASNTTDWSYIRQGISITSGIYLVSFDVLSIDKMLHIGLGVSGNDISMIGTHTQVYEASGTTDFQIRPSSTGLYNVEIDNISVKQLSGTYQIQNYTDSCRDEAKQLHYGSQSANYKINGLGMRTDESPYFECSELFDNYGDTGWIPSATEDWTIEFIAYVPPSLEYKDTLGIFGNDTSDSTKVRFYIGSGAKPHCWVGNEYTNTTSFDDEYLHWIFVYNNINDSYQMYWNGILYENQANVGLIQGSTTMKIANTVTAYNYFKDLRLLKVHQKALTQEEVTKAYTDAVNKGLLI